MSPTSKRGNLGSELTPELILAAPSDGAGYESVGEENGNLIMEEVVEELPELTPANRSAGVNQLEPDSLHHPMSAGVDESIGKGGCALLKERQDEAAGLIPGLNQLEHDSSPLPAAGAGESVCEERAGESFCEERGNLDLEEAVETPVLIAASKSNNNWSNFDDIEDADDWSKNMEDAVPEEHLHESKVESTDFTPLPSEGEKKLSKVIVPDKWKEGANNTSESGGRKINENRWTPYGNTKCIIRKQQVLQDGKYFHTCAYSKAVPW